MDVRFILNEEMEYEGFEFELKDGILRFFGREWDMFMFIFEFEGDEEIFEYVYFLMFEFFELRQRVKNFKDILNKIRVFIIGNDFEEIRRIVKIVK